MLNATTEPADTFGWDTVFALRVPDVNAAIARANTSPQGFSQRIEDGCTVSGTFADWRICQGGDGKLLRLALPILAGQVEEDGHVTAFRDATAVAEVQLRFFENTTPRPAPGSGSFHDLKIAPAPAPGQAAVTVLHIQFAAGQAPFLVEALLPAGLTSWLNQHLELFDHVFATINLNRLAAQGDFQWLLPTATDYAYVERATLEESFLAVLCMTENRPFRGLLPQLSAGAVPRTSRAGFLINNARFLLNVVLPSLPRAFAGLTVADFELATGDTLRLLRPKTIATTASDGQRSTAQLTTLTVTLTHNALELRAICVSDISPGIYAHCDALHRYGIRLLTTPAGQQTLHFKEVGTPVVSKWTSQAPGMEYLPWMETAAGLVLTVLLGIVTEGAGLVIGGVVIAALVGAATQAPELLALLGTDQAPDLALLTLHTTNLVEWKDCRHFRLNAAKINSSLQLGGTFAAD